MNLLKSMGPGDINQDGREIPCDEWWENEKKSSCGVVFIEVHSNDLAEWSTSGSTNSQYFPVKFHDLTDN